jgi:hypothetical protein
LPWATANSTPAPYRALKGPIDAFWEMIRGLETRLSAMDDSPKAAEGFRRKFEDLRDRMIDGDNVTNAEKFEALRLAETRVMGNGYEFRRLQ